MTTTVAPRRGYRRWYVLLAVLALPITLLTVFLVTGGSASIIKTPSMGTYAPVNTVVFTRPVALADVRVGEPLLFVPPGNDRTYFHRVTSISPTGVIHTRGDLNADVDPWTLTAANLRGTELFRIIDLGWLIQALPLLGLGGITLLLAVRGFVPSGYRFPALLGAGGLLWAVNNFLLQPWYRAEMLDTTTVQHVTTVRLVATGILPIKVSLADGTPVVLNNGEATNLRHTGGRAADLILHIQPDLNPLLLAFVILLTLAPMAVITWRAVRAYRLDVPPATVAVEAPTVAFVPAATPVAQPATVTAGEPSHPLLSMTPAASSLFVDSAWQRRVSF